MSNNDDIIQSLYESGIIVNNEDDMINIDNLTDELKDDFAELFNEEKTEYDKDIDERFRYLVEGEMKIEEGSLEPRKVIESKLGDFFIDGDTEEIDDDNFLSDIDLSIEQLREEQEKELDESTFNLNNPIVNIPEETLTEYILIRGVYSSVFKEFVKNDNYIPQGDMPLAIEINGTVIKIKSISPDPKTLYRIKRTLIGYDIMYINEDVEQPLDIFQFLGKIKITG